MEVVVLAPRCQGCHLLSVHCPIIAGDQADNICAVSNVLIIVLDLWIVMQSCMNRKHRRRLSAQLVLRARVENVVLPLHTAWHLTARKFRIQSHRAVLSPVSLMASLQGTIRIEC